MRLIDMLVAGLVFTAYLAVGAFGMVTVSEAIYEFSGFKVPSEWLTIATALVFVALPLAVSCWLQLRETHSRPATHHARTRVSADAEKSFTCRWA